RRRLLFDELAARHAALAAGSTPVAVYFGAEQPVLSVSVRLVIDGPFIPLQPEELAICDLSDWRRPAALAHPLPGGGSYYTQASVDPITGRIAFPDIAARAIPVDDDPIDPNTGHIKTPLNRVPLEVKVSCSHGFPGDVGSGPYDRSDSIDASFHFAGDAANPAVWQVGVSRTMPAIGTEQVFSTLQAAVQAWNALPAGTVGVIVMMDALCYQAGDDTANPVAKVLLQAGSSLLIAAAGWPLTDIPNGGGVKERRAGNFSVQNLRAHFRGDIEVSDNTAAGSTAPGRLVLNGLLIEGTITVNADALDAQSATVPGNLGLLQLDHVTLNPGRAALSVEGHNERLNISLTRSISGALDLGAETPAIRIDNSIIDAQAISGTPALSAPSATLQIGRSTVFGSIAAKLLYASETLFMDPVTVAQKQSGCVRFCYLAEGSRTPSRFECQPDLALAKAPAADAETTRLRVKPQFTAQRYGDPAYTQLARATASEISQGAEDSAEIGVWNFLKQPQRIANLNASLDEYLRAGLEAGVLFAT
ncbi:MAG: hypothetical protein ABI588_08665, partial [Arenimonas sp.]